jgi:hypothetical protein
VLFVEGVRVDEGAVGGLGLGAVVEDPYDLRWVVTMRSGVEVEGLLGLTYGDHGEQDVAGCCGLKGRDGRVDERVDRGAGHDEACREEADDLG